MTVQCALILLVGWQDGLTADKSHAAAVHSSKVSWRS